MHNYFLIGKRLSLKRLLIILLTWPFRRGFVSKINIFKTFYNLRWVCYNLRQLFDFYNLRQPVFTFYDSFGTNVYYNLRQFLQFTTIFTIYDSTKSFVREYARQLCSTVFCHPVYISFVFKKREIWSRPTLIN